MSSILVVLALGALVAGQGVAARGTVGADTAYSDAHSSVFSIDPNVVNAGHSMIGLPGPFYPFSLKEVPQLQALRRHRPPPRMRPAPASPTCS